MPHLVCATFDLVAVLRILFVCKGPAGEAKDRTPACAHLARASSRPVPNDGEMCGRPTAYGTLRYERLTFMAFAGWRG